jgi:hypothetical protein
MNLHTDTTGDGPDLVLVHGWGLHGGIWETLLPELALRPRMTAAGLAAVLVGGLGISAQHRAGEHRAQGTSSGHHPFEAHRHRTSSPSTALCMSPICARYTA